jgi:hypothetical protein
MWVSGGNMPDHSVLGRFISKHEQELSALLFEQVVSRPLKNAVLDSTLTSPLLLTLHSVGQCDSMTWSLSYPRELSPVAVRTASIG